MEIDPNRPFDSRVIDFSDYCDIISESLEKLRSLGMESAGLEYYSIEFDELTKLFEREPK